MRVIAGSAKSLPLKTVSGDLTRPTTDRIKETLFNMLQPYIPGCRFLDLFSGSGAIGIEALSRGAAHAVFVDNARECESVILENLRFTKLSPRAEVLRYEVLSAIDRLERTSEAPFDLVFMDPPYGNGLEEAVLKRLFKSPLISDDTVLIFEASMKTDISFAEGLGFELLKDKQYKTNRHVWVKRAEA